MTEQRVESETGGAKGVKLARFDQIPAGPMLELAYRYGLGSTKYESKNGIDNWRNGYPFSLSMAALERHYYAFKAGQDTDDSIYAEAGLLGEGENPLYDEEGKLRGGVSHLAAVVWHCFFLMHHLEHNPELDDRPSTVLARQKDQDTLEPEMTADAQDLASQRQPEYRDVVDRLTKASEPPRGALGLFQFMPGSWSQYDPGRHVLNVPGPDYNASDDAPLAQYTVKADGEVVNNWTGETVIAGVSPEEDDAALEAERKKSLQMGLDRDQRGQ